VSQLLNPRTLPRAGQRANYKNELVPFAHFSVSKQRPPLSSVSTSSIYGQPLQSPARLTHISTSSSNFNMPCKWAGCGEGTSPASKRNFIYLCPFPHLEISLSRAYFAHFFMLILFHLPTFVETMMSDMTALDITCRGCCSAFLPSFPNGCHHRLRN
jgi:hypothetical protein